MEGLDTNWRDVYHAGCLSEGCYSGQTDSGMPV
jgi:hypothetical protein